MQLLTILTVIATVIAQDSRIQFTTANGNAITSAQTPFTTISVTKQPKGAQILYQQLTKDNTLAPLVTVYIVNTVLGLEIPIQTGYDTIAQACSCYWIDYNTIIAKKVPSSAHWKLAFRGEKTGLVAMNVVSGEFGLTWTDSIEEGFVGTFTVPDAPQFTFDTSSADLNKIANPPAPAAPKPTLTLKVVPVPTETGSTDPRIQTTSDGVVLNAHLVIVAIVTLLSFF